MRNADKRNAIQGNPFRYGTIVDEPFFINRKRELAEIRNMLVSGENLILYAPRRFGKTSLVNKVKKELQKQGYPCIYIDFFRIFSREKFIENYAAQIFQNYSSWEKMIQKVSTILKSVRPVVTFNMQGIPELGIKVETKQMGEAVSDIVNLPENLANEKPWIVILDEFQEIERLNGENFEKELRSSFQFHKKVHYAFLGSRKHFITNMFSRNNRAFYNFGRLYKLDKIPEAEVNEFIESGFKKTGFSIEQGVSDAIIKLANNIPYYIQMLASALWDYGKVQNQEVNSDLFAQAVGQVLWHQNDYYLALIQELTAYQQKVLSAIAVENSGLFTKSYTDKYFLSAQSSTQRAISVLIKKEIISKSGNEYNFEDPLLKLWLLKKD